jgi:hypothetical protein
MPRCVPFSYQVQLLTVWTYVQIKQLVTQLKQEWQGDSYDLLARNCCHFCEDMAKRLSVQPIPGKLVTSQTLAVLSYASELPRI